MKNEYDANKMLANNQEDRQALVAYKNKKYREGLEIKKQGSRDKFLSILIKILVFIIVAVISYKLFGGSV